MKIVLENSLALRNKNGFELYFVDKFVCRNINFLINVEFLFDLLPLWVKRSTSKMHSEV